MSAFSCSPSALTAAIIHQYNALWAMNKRAKEVSQSKLHVSCRLKFNSRNSTIIHLESSYSSQDPPPKKKRGSVQVPTCTDAPHCFVKASYHVGLCSRNKFERNQFSRSQDIEARFARAHVHSDTPWAC